MSTRLSARMRDRAPTVGFLVLLVAFIGLVLVPAYRLASQLSADTAALKLASEQRGQPLAIAKSLLAVRDRLGHQSQLRRQGSHRPGVSRGLSYAS